ncbi:MAG: hypothetical protein ACO26I_03940 [Burkholderiaceae bacterium]
MAASWRLELRDFAVGRTTAALLIAGLAGSVDFDAGEALTAEESVTDLSLVWGGALGAAGGAFCLGDAALGDLPFPLALGLDGGAATVFFFTAFFTACGMGFFTAVFAEAFEDLGAEALAVAFAPALALAFTVAFFATGFRWALAGDAALARAATALVFEADEAALVFAGVRALPLALTALAVGLAPLAAGAFFFVTVISSSGGPEGSLHGAWSLFCAFQLAYRCLPLAHPNGGTRPRQIQERR